MICGVGEHLIKVQNFLEKDFIEIDEFELLEIRRAEDNLILIRAIDELFIVAHETYVEFEVELSKLTILEAAKIETDPRFSGVEAKTRLNIRLLSLLTAIKCYVDQTKKLVSELLPQEDAGSKFWGEKLAETRAKSFDYRVMELIRNSSQQHSLPVSYRSLNVKNHRDSLYPSQEVSLGFFIGMSDIQNMAPTKRKDEQTKTEMTELDVDRFDLVLLTRSYVQSVCEQHKALCQFTQSIFRESCKSIEYLHENMRINLNCAKVTPVVGQDDFIFSDSTLTFIKDRHTQTNRRFANVNKVQLSFYPKREKTYPSIALRSETTIPSA